VKREVERESTAKAKHMKMESKRKKSVYRKSRSTSSKARGASRSVISKIIIIIISGDSSHISTT
jgi:hypothetical protein